MSLFYDLHIHSALSPCGDEDMTPNNIVNMSVLKGLDVIAVTDHNSAANARSCVECGKRAGILVLPGIEIETSEEVHLLALFSTPDDAENMSSVICNKLPKIKNRVDIFGEQYVMDCDDNIVDIIPNLLSTATQISLNDAVKLVRELNGVAIPAHIDKSSYSIFSNLGFIPDELAFSTLEVKDKGKSAEVLSSYKTSDFKLISNSDAHFLWDINERINSLDIGTPDYCKIIDYLRQK